MRAPRRIRITLQALLAAAILAAVAAAPAQAEFGFKELDVRLGEKDGSPAVGAGAHPFELVTQIDVNTEEEPGLGTIPSEQARNTTIHLPEGLIGSPTSTPRCEGVDFATVPPGEPALPECSESSVIGLAAVRVFLLAPTNVGSPVYNLVPPPGVAAKIGFLAGGVPVTVEVDVNESPPYNVIARATNITQMVRFYGATVTLWGNPSSPDHDEDRGRCGTFISASGEGGEYFPGEKCPTSNPDVPFLTLPRACTGPLTTLFEMESWQNPGSWVSQAVQSHDNSVPPEPVGISECERLGFAPRVSVRPTSSAAESPTGLDVDLRVDDLGLTDPEGRAGSDISKAVLTLPEGMTINPSQAEGLGVCSEAELARETPRSPFGAGCPADSKVGSVEVQTPLLEGTTLRGSLFVAEPYENRFGSLLALFMTIKDPERGVAFRLAGEVEPDPASGRIATTFDEVPPWPFSRLRVHLREGGRSPLVTPPACGPHTARMRFTPSGDPGASLTETSVFEIDSGPGGGPCPAGSTPPFDPGFEAGSLNNAAGRYSPFSMRLTRRDGDQDLTRFAATLPPGMTGRLAGVSRCPDAQIALARAKSGRAELASPSCPAGSEIGSTTAGAGVGSELVYVPGSLYLAGPYNGAPLSAVAITPAVAGPFDAGTVVVQVALQVDPRSARITADGSRSDPIPHILQGIVLKVRDVRVDVDRPSFTLNPTSCARERVAAQIWGGGADPFSLADDAPLSREAPFQAAGCRALGFRPRLSLRLKGGVRRGAHPALRAVLRPRPGDANISDAVVRLPRSAFLEQGHIRTICTRVQFAARNCPKGAIYGRVRAFTPLLSEPLQGPVYLRSSNNNLPDLVFDLRGLVDFEAVGRLDSRRGGIRATFTRVPDAPISRVVLDMQGGRKGLIVNSTDLCRKKRRVNALFKAHNGRRQGLRPLLRPLACAGKRKAARSAHRRG
jgi:hypothetical protein